MGRKLHRVWGYIVKERSVSQKERGLNNDVERKQDINSLLFHPVARYWVAAIFAPPISIMTSIWLFSGMPYLLPEGFMRDPGSHSVAMGGTALLSLIIGTPIMIIIGMPLCRALKKRKQGRVHWYIGGGVIIGWLLAQFLLPVLFLHGDAKAMYWPTIFSGGMAMMLAWLIYVVNDPEFPF